MFRLPHAGPELRLIAQTSYFPSDDRYREAQGNRIRSLLAGEISRLHFVELITRHRTYAMAPTVLRAYGLFENAIPRSQQETVLRDENICRRQALLLAGESSRLVKRLADEGVEAITLKGPQLSRRLYGDSGLRHSKDIDLYVLPAGLEKAVQILISENYRLNPDCELVWTRYRAHLSSFLHEITFVNHELGTSIDLHWGIDEGALSVRYEAIWQSWIRQDRVVSEFAFLVWHASKHAWHRIKWLGDIATIVSGDQSIYSKVKPWAASLKLERNFRDAAALMRYFDLSPNQNSTGIERSTYFPCYFDKADPESQSDESGLREKLEKFVGQLVLNRRYPVLTQLKAAARSLWSTTDLRYWRLPGACIWLLPLLRPLSIALRQYRASRGKGS